MKRFLAMLTLSLSFAGLICPSFAAAYNFGDFRSETLTAKAWGALAEDDMEAVLAYTNKCLELYAEDAKKMQDGLSDYPEGENDKIFAYWALNDIATCLFIQGQAYQRADMEEEAKEAYEKLVNEYSYGQAWDANGWFWKPTNAAKEKMAMMKSGIVLDFGDYSSAFITTQAWRALEAGNVEKVVSYADKVLELYEKDAEKMQDSLTEYPWQSREQIFNYWALNDVGTCLFIKGKALMEAGENGKAKENYEKLVDNFYYAQCWDNHGWFWKPSEAAQEALDGMEKK